MKRHASMNRIYRLVWSQVFNTWVAVAENAKGRGKSISGRRSGFNPTTIFGHGFVGLKPDLRITILAASLALIGSSAYAEPSGGQVSAGAGSIAQAGANTTITQSSQNLAINWQSFGIAANEAVRFDQPNASAIALNRVLGQNPSQILGSLTANGQVFILNPNGVLFGAGSQVNVGGLVASTLNLSDADLMAGKHVFGIPLPQAGEGQGRGSVVNQGTLTAAQGGYIALLAPEVRNEGVISATLGTALLAAGDKVTLNLNNGSLLSYSIDQGSLKALADNKQLIQADGGQVFMSAKAANALSAAMVNNTGIIEARTVQNVAGVIMLMGDMQVGTVSVGGTLDASAPEGGGGKVVVTGEHVLIDSGAHIDATGATGGGEVYVGGGWQGKDASIDNASAVVMQPTAMIDVSATVSGNAGTAVLWSQDYTSFSGYVAAKGGKDGGNGGKVETSSHNILQAFGQVDAGAKAGLAGSWLLDPFDVTIVGSGASSTPAYSATFTPTADSTILNSSISTSLSNGASVTITTGTSGGAAGNITVDAAITQAANYYSDSQTLTLKAANDIAVNAAISGTNSGPKLNVVLTADADGSGVGNINFGAAGQISMNGGSFYAGDMSTGTLTKLGQNLTMTAGSFIDIANNYSLPNTLDIKLNGVVTLADNSLKGVLNWYDTNQIIVTGTSIVTSNLTAAVPDILSTTRVYLNADDIGSGGTPIKVSAGPSASAKVYTNNTVGNSYVNVIGPAQSAYVDLTIGSQANKTQSVQITNTAGTGAVLLNTDNTGVLNLVANNIKTDVTATHVRVNAPNITFTNNSVNTGVASFTADVSVGSPYSMRSLQVDGTGDISGSSVQFIGAYLGTVTDPLEVGTGTNLTVYNNGGSTFIKSVSDDFTNINLTNHKNTGTHAILFSGGDHIDYISNGTDVFLPTIGGGASNGSNFGGTTGIDVTRRNRNVTLTAATGNIVFDNNSVDTRAGSFTAQIHEFNPDGDIAALNVYDANTLAAQITAGNVTFNVNNKLTPAASTIGAATKDIQIAQGAGTTNNTLTVYTQQGDVKIHELTPNDFKTLKVTLNSASAAQNVAIDLMGSSPDDVNFSDSGSLVSIDANKVNLSANNRNWDLSTPNRSIQIDGTSLGSGYYYINAGNSLRLNADVLTNGGAISLTSDDSAGTSVTTGIQLLRSVRVDSNADDTGNTSSTGGSGQISIRGTLLSAAAADSNTLTVDSSTSTQYVSGGTIWMYSGANKTNVANSYSGGGYLTGLTLMAQGLSASYDGGINIQGANYFLNGSFFSAGNSYLDNQSVNATTIDTEQGNLTHGGNITFSGRDISSNLFRSLTFNTATTAASGNGGNVNLYGTSIPTTLTAKNMTVSTVGGSGGTSGSINLPAVNTADYLPAGAQSYTGGIITLNGNLSTFRGNVTLTGDTRLANSATIDTWLLSTNFSAAPQTGAAGTVTIGGVGLSATATGKNLTIDTSTDTGAGYFGSGTALYTHNGGNVTIAAGNAGGAYVNTLVVNTSPGGSHNSSLTKGTIALNTVGTEGAQTYTGGATTLSGSLTSNGGNIDLSGAASLALSGASVTIDTDRIGGSNSAGTLSLGSNALNNATALTIDTTADGGGTGTDLVLTNIGNTTPLSSVNVAAKALTVSSGGVSASGDITLEARGATSDLTLNAVVTSSNGSIVLAAGQNFINNVGSSALSSASGRWLVYSTSPAGSTESGLTAVAGSTLPRLYNKTYATDVPASISTGNHLIYSTQPALTVTADNQTRSYGDANAAFNSSTIGFVSDDGVTDTLTTAGISGTAAITSLATAASPVTGGSPLAITPAIGDLASSAGYGFNFVDGGLTITARPVTVTVTAGQTKVYGSADPSPLTFANTGLGSGIALNGSLTRVAGESVLGGPYSITQGTLTNANNSNYNLTYNGGTFAITPANLSLSGTRVYNGTTNFAGSNLTATGVNGETFAITGDGAAGNLASKDFQTGSTLATLTGLTLGADNGAALATNYNAITTVGSLVDVTKADLLLTGSQVYNGGTAYAGVNLTATGVASETFAITGTGAAGNLASKDFQTGSALATLTSLTLGASGNGGLAGNYNTLSVTGAAADITKAPLTVTADDKTRLYGAANPTLTTTVSGFVNGETAGTAAGFTGAGSATTLADATTSVGTALITAGAGNLLATNYAFTNLIDGTLTITPTSVPPEPLPVSGILPAVVEAITALPGGGGVLLPAFSSTVAVAATQIDAVAPPSALSNLQYMYVTTATPGNLSGDIDTTADGKAVPTKAQGGKSDGFNERLPDAPIQFTGTVIIRNGGIKLSSDADDSNERDKKIGNE